MRAPILLALTAALIPLACADPGSEASSLATTQTPSSASITATATGSSGTVGDTADPSSTADPTTTTADPTAATTAATTAGPSDCSAISDDPAWQLCASGDGTCEGVFTDGAGCDALCAAVGMFCAQVHEDIDGVCAPDLERPPVGCAPPSGHKSDYCVCVADPQGCTPSCAGKTCGSDGCGGTCGACGDGETCSDGVCASGCDVYPFPAESLLAERVGFGAATTGGDPAKPYIVDTLADSGAGSLRAALESDEPYWIGFSVAGEIKIAGNHIIKVKSNKTIDGRGRDITVNGTLRIDDARNIIINDIRARNNQEPKCTQDGDVLLLIGEGGDDPDTYTTRDIWIHHVELFDGGDGLLDLRGASRVTASWNHLHAHNKAMLMWQTRSGKPATGMRVTLHHNFMDRLTLRGPQFIYGWLHFFNNYQFEWYEYGAGSLGGAQMLSEANVYQARPGAICLDCPDPNPCGGNDLVVSKEGVVNDWADNGTGFVRSVGDLKLEDAKIAVASPEKVFTAADHYAYQADTADAALKTKIAAEAGPRTNFCGG